MTKTRKKVLRKGGSQQTSYWKALSDDSLVDIVINAPTVKELNNYCSISCRVAKLCKDNKRIKNRKNFLINYEEILKKYNSNKSHFDRLLVLDSDIENDLDENLFKDIDENLVKDKKFVSSVIKEIPLLLKHTAFKNDKDVVMIAVGNDAEALKFASTNLRQDPEVVLKAISTEAEAGLEYADDMFMEDPTYRDVVMTAVKSVGTAYLLTEDIYNDDTEMILEAVKTEPLVIDYITDTLKNDRDFIMKVAKNSGFAVKYADKKFLRDPEIATLAVNNMGESLEDFNDVIKDDRNIVLAAIKQNGTAIRFASRRLKKHKDIRQAARDSKNKKSNYEDGVKFSKIMKRIENKIFD